MLETKENNPVFRREFLLRNLKSNLLCLPFLLISIVCISQSQDSIKLILEDPDTIELSTIHVTDKANGLLRGITTAIRIDSSQLKDFADLEMTRVINRQPGLYVHSGAINTNRITIRGVGSRNLYGTNKVRAYYNDIPVTSGIGDTQLDQFDPADIKEIQIQKGPKATGYGSNLGGAIILMTEKAAYSRTHFISATHAGSWGTFKQSLSASAGNSQFGARFQYTHLEQDGYRENSGYNRNGYLLDANYAPDNKSLLHLLFNHIHYRAMIPSSIGETQFRVAPDQAAESWADAEGYEKVDQALAGISYSRSFPSDFNGKVTIYYNTTTFDEPRPFNILRGNSAAYGLRSVFKKTFNEKPFTGDLKIGGEFILESYDWETLENLYEENMGEGSLAGQLLSENEELRNQFFLFATLKIHLAENLQLEAGFNLNKNFYSYKGGPVHAGSSQAIERSFKPIPCPGLSLNYQFKKEGQFFLNISRGFNYPSLEEALTPEGVINPSIGPEKGWSYEAGSRVSIFQKSITFDIGAYVMNISDLLVADRIGQDQYIGRNAGKTIHRGIEFMADYHGIFSQKIELNISTAASLNFHKFIEFTDREEDFSGNKLTGVPERQLNISAKLQYDSRVYLLSNFLHIGSMPMNDENSLYSHPYSVFDLKLGFRKSLGHHFHFDLFFKIDNVLDEEYASSILINATAFGTSEPRYYYPGRPRGYFIGISIDYRFQ